MPLWSMAAMVLAKFGAFLLATMASISACSLLIPSLKAGRKCSFCILSKGGTWNGVVRAWKNGLIFATSLGKGRRRGQQDRGQQDRHSQE